MTVREQQEKFMDEALEKPNNHRLMAKYIALAVVIFVILLLCVLAWFTSGRSASASGLTVKTVGSGGLEVSLDGGTNWDDAWGSAEGRTDWDGQYKYNTDNVGGSPMQLLSGNGRNLYYAGNVDGSGNADNFQKISDNDAGNYCMEFEAYFRCDSPITIGLSSECSVSPLDTAQRLYTPSVSGVDPFSADYIAGASRVAFLEKTEDEKTKEVTLTKKGLWIPNKDYEIQNVSGNEIEYRKMQDNFGGTVEVTSGGNPTDTTGTSDYYLWTLDPTAVINMANETTKNRTALSQLYSIPMQQVAGSTNKYYCQFYTVQPEEGRPEQMFMINTSKTDWQSTASSESNIKNYLTGFDNDSSIFEEVEVDGVPTLVNKLYWQTGGTYNVNVQYGGDRGNYGFNYDTYYFWQLNFTRTIAYEDAVKLVRIEYDSATKKAVLTYPDKSEVIISKDQGTMQLNVGEQIVVTKASGTDINAMNSAQNPVSFDPSADNSLCDLTVKSVKDEEGSYSYKLSFADGKYLAVGSDGTLQSVATESEASYFYVFFSNSKTTDEDGKEIYEKYLGYVDNSSGSPIIKYIVYNGSAFGLSTDKSGAGYMIYKKSTKPYSEYSFKSNGTAEDKYYYWNGSAKTALAADEYEVAPESYTNLITLSTKETIGDTEYYTGKLLVRIFAEGYDREAVRPMEKGKIKATIVFKAYADGSGG